jgi:hypothetical protein
METTIETPAPQTLAEEVTSKIATLETQIETLRKTLAECRNQISDFYEAINSEIADNQANEDSDTTYGSLSSTMESIFGNPLTFSKEYEAVVRFTVDAVVRYMAKDDDDADQIAGCIELNVDTDNLSYYGDAEVVSVEIDDTRTRSVETV